MELDMILQSYIAKAHEARGSIIDHAILLERHMDEFVSDYFTDTKERQLEMVEMLISTLTYSAKVNLFAAILTKVLKKETVSINIEDVKKNLQAVAKCRNKFAHDILYLDIPYQKMIQYNICLVSFTNISQPVYYTEKQILDILSKTQKAIDEIMSIRKLIKDGNPPT